jgi:hypothetical protein
MQAVQAAVAPSPVLYVPPAQAGQAVAAGAEDTVPCTHGRQLDSAVAAREARYVPEGQATHAEALGWGPYVPPAHAMQRV